jgi:YCII-related domain.
MNKEGVVLLAGRTQLETNDPDMMGLVIFYAKDEKEAADFMMNDPAVKNKIMLAKVLPYGIAVGACK